MGATSKPRLWILVVVIALIYSVNNASLRDSLVALENNYESKTQRSNDYNEIIGVALDSSGAFDSNSDSSDLSEHDPSLSIATATPTPTPTAIPIDSSSVVKANGHASNTKNTTEYSNDNNNDNNTNNTVYYKHDFSYDLENWSSPRIVILAGPHKTASTSLQEFFVKIAGSRISVTGKYNSLELSGSQPGSKYDDSQKHYTVDDWVWPLGIKAEYDGGSETSKNLIGGGIRHARRGKSFAALASFVTGRRIDMFFSGWTTEDTTEGAEIRKNCTEQLSGYYRSLFRIPWNEGNKILIAAEAFDTFAMGLREKGRLENDRSGEDVHVWEEAGHMIDALLGMFPWDTGENNNTAKQSQLRLKLEDIEAHVNIRIPKMQHIVSIWHQMGHKSTLRGFLQRGGRAELYQSNSLALALQLVRKGIKTTLVDMAGVKEHEAALSNNNNNTNNNSTTFVVGGLHGVVACDILNMATCDDQSKLHLPSEAAPAADFRSHKGDDKNVYNLNDEQLNEIEKLFEEYDCSVWQHLSKYQHQGLLRVLYPSQHLLETCPQHGAYPDIAFRSVLEEISEIAYRDNGIPRVPKRELPTKKKRTRARKNTNESNPLSI